MRFIPLFWGSLQQMGPCKSVKSFRAFVNARDFEQCEHIQIKDPKEARHYNQVTFTPIATYGQENRQMLHEDNHFLISRSKYVVYGLLQCDILIVCLETNGIFSPSKA